MFGEHNPADYRTGPAVSPEAARGIAQGISQQLANSKPRSWYELRITRNDAAELLGWTEEKLAEIDAKLAENDAAKRAAEQKRSEVRRLKDETQRVIRELKADEEEKLRQRAEKIARERLGM